LNAKRGKKMKSFKYKGWYCRWNDSEGLYFLYTPEEMEQPAGFRYYEIECTTKEQCREFIDGYKSISPEGHTPVFESPAGTGRRKDF
jgi:hypothetical protein